MSDPQSTPSMYLASFHPIGGKTMVTLGLMEGLSARVNKLGYFRPVAGEQEDSQTALVQERYNLADRTRHAYTDEELDDMIAKGKEEEAMKHIIATYRELAAECEFVFISGADFNGQRTNSAYDFNLEVARNIGAPMITVVNAEKMDMDTLRDEVSVARKKTTEGEVTRAGLIINRVQQSVVRKALEEFEDYEIPVGIIEESRELAMPTLAEVMAELHATPVRGSEDLDNTVDGFIVGAMSIPNVIKHLRDDALLITPGDRPEILAAAIMSRLSSNGPSVSGVVLTGGFTTDPALLDLIEGLERHRMPVYSTDLPTYEAASAVARVRSRITAGHSRRATQAVSVFERNVRTKSFLDRVKVTRSDVVTPLMFEFDLIERARRNRRHIVLPEGLDDRILIAAEILQQRGVAHLTLLGDEDEIRRRAIEIAVSLDGIAIVDPTKSDRLSDYADAYVEARKHKGMTKEVAMETMQDVSYFGSMMVQLGDADGMVSGAVNTTAHTITPAFQFIKTKPGVENVSSSFLMLMPDRVLVYADCAVIPNPTAEQLADVAISSAETARMFRIEPRIAMLSYSTGESGKGQDVDKVREATAIVRQRRPDLLVEGPIQYDAAVDPAVGAKKLPGSPVAGRATVFIFPDLNTGNNTYKAVQRSSGATAVGPVLQGLNKPVNDLSRGALVADIVNTVAITAIQAQEGKS